MARTMRVLSIDGGGIRGIIPALVLARLEEGADAPVSRLFDLVAGTSTGGILALALAKPGADGKPAFRARDLVGLYEREGERIFSRSVRHRIRAAGNLAEEKYPATGIESVLERYFGDARLRDAATDVLVPCYEIERRTPFFFRSRRAREDERYDFAMRDVARATSAAPTYFEPHRLPATDDPLDYYALVDGGVYANNPAMCAYAEARSLDPEAEILMLSLGTGEQTRPISYDDARGWGLARWAQPILSVVFDGVSDTVDHQLRQLLPSDDAGRARYLRLQLRLDQGSDDMDDASRSNLRILRLVAEELLDREGDRVDALCEQLRAEPQPA